MARLGSCVWDCCSHDHYISSGMSPNVDITGWHFACSSLGSFIPLPPPSSIIPFPLPPLPLPSSAPPQDVVTRYAHQSGFHVERRFGWDCHGLPVEYEIDKTLGVKVGCGLFLCVSSASSMMQACVRTRVATIVISVPLFLGIRTFYRKHCTV